MILNSNTPFGNINSKGEGAVITPHVLLWRCVIVRAIMDGLDVDIHAWGNARENIVKDAIAWFSLKEPHFCLACDYANLEPSFIIKRFKQLQTANTNKKFHGKNLNKFLTHYICSIHEEPDMKRSA